TGVRPALSARFTSISGLLSKSFTTCKLATSAARASGVRPLMSTEFISTSFHSSSASTNSVLRFSYPQAQNSGVRPIPWLELTSARLRRVLTTSSCPFPAAWKSGVRSNLSAKFGLTSARLRKTLTTPSCPFPAAWKSGVSPY
ncbi:hypothetical protein L873DRAFT_1695111, partial [Choiromyces venosus 120613-1]